MRRRRHARPVDARRGGRGGAVARRRAGGDAPAPVRSRRGGRGARCTRTTTCSATRRCAIRAATSFRPTSPTSCTATKFVNTLIKTASRAPGDGAVHGRRQAVPGRLVRRQDGAGVPPARARHVRAAGSPERLPVPGRPADAAVRQRRLDARVPDGREVRSHPRRRSTVRSRRSRTSWPKPLRRHGRRRRPARPAT